MREVQGWVLLGLNRQSLIHATRTTVAAVASRSAPLQAPGGVLGCRDNFSRDAVVARRGPQDLRGAPRGHSIGSSSRRSAGRQVWSEYYRVRGRRFCSGIALLHSASRAQCLPLCWSHARRRDASAARHGSVERSRRSFHRGGYWNCGGLILTAIWPERAVIE